VQRGVRRSRVDVPQQSLSLFDGDTTLQDLGVTLLVEFSLNDDKGLSVACKPSGLCLIRRDHHMDEAIEVRDPPVKQGGWALPLDPRRSP
jgi:hypothetical protein